MAEKHHAPRASAEEEAAPPGSSRDPKHSARPFRRSAAARWLRRALVSSTVLYAMMVVAFSVLQERLVFPASHALRHSHTELALPHQELDLLTSDGETIHARWVPHLEARGTVIYFHGNGGNLGDAHPLALRYARLGVNVLLVDYRGYGESSGQPSEAGLYLDARAAYDFLRNQLNVPADEVVIHGRSLGGAVSVHLAAQVPCAGVILESTFTRLSDVASIHYPWLPISLLLRPRFESIEKIGSIRAPMLIAHSSQDTLIPLAQAEQLLRAASPETRFLALKGDHNDTVAATGPAYEEGIAAFLTAVLPLTKAGP